MEEWNSHVVGTVKKLYFGKYLWDLYSETKKEIVNRLNPLWLDPNILPSGTSFPQLLQAMSRASYSIEAKVEGKKAIASRVRRNGQANRKALTTENTSLEKEVLARMAK